MIAAKDGAGRKEAMEALQACVLKIPLVGLLDAVQMPIITVLNDQSADGASK